MIEKATDIYVTFTEHAFEFMVKAALGISKNYHEEETVITPHRSTGVSMTFKVIYKFEDFVDKIR